MSDTSIKKPLFYGILGAFFFAFTFILNRSMNLGGGHWMWSACLRYFYTLPILFVMLAVKGQLKDILKDIRENLWFWILWSTVGFGLFYAPLSLASAYGESWMIASTWQITIVAGVLLTPLFGRKIPIKNLCMSMIILAGIFLMQSAHFAEAADSAGRMIMILIPILIAAFSYPLGNRMTMAHCPANLNSFQRIFGMTLCSIPFWMLCAVYAGTQAGAPSLGQHLQSMLVALFSGVIATCLFFKATDLVKHNPKQLAIIEATQSGEVIFTLIGGICFLGDSMPSTAGFAGIILIIAGMTASSLLRK